MTDMETLSRRRRRMMLIMALIFILWQGSAVLGEYLTGQPYASVLAMLSNAGIIAWALATIMLVRFSVQVRKARAFSVINDEWFESVRQRALAFGYSITLLAVAVAFMVPHYWKTVSASSLSRLLLIIAVTAPLFAFVCLEGQAGRSQDET